MTETDGRATGAVAPESAPDTPPSPFHSILFERPDDRAAVAGSAEPAYFPDLHLDQVVAAITRGRGEYELTSFFHEPLRDVATIAYRHEVLRDLESEALRSRVGSFAQRMRDVRVLLAGAEKDRYRYHEEGILLDAVARYCHAVSELAADLARAELRSRGLRSFRDYLVGYVSSPRFESMLGETRRLQQDLASVRYCIHIKGNRVRVRRYESEADYSETVLETFERFRQGEVADHLVSFSDGLGMNHVEAAILDRVALLFSDTFAALDDYCARHRGFLDETVRAFDREVQFYIAYLEFIRQFQLAGLDFCYPEVSCQSKEVFANASFDIALANKLVPQDSPVVPNDFYLAGPERVLVVSGPNQGGKTTFARMFGQLHHLAAVGLPVPGTRARLFLYDQLFTHFEKEEDPTYRAGKLEEDLVRIRDVLNAATKDSIIILNEIFTSTTASDALVLGEKVMATIVELDLLCVYVTFIDELASFSESTVSVVSTVLPENPAERTFRIVRRPADGRAYAIAIAEKYGLTYEQLRRRIPR